MNEQSGAARVSGRRMRLMRPGHVLAVVLVLPPDLIAAFVSA